MTTLNQIKKPTKSEQRMAITSYSALSSALDRLENEETEIEFEEIKDKIKIPLKAFKLLADILKTMSDGKSVSIVSSAAEVSTQKAAEILGCSRPHIVKLLEEGKINFTKVGKHRRILLDDLIKFKENMKREQKKHIIDIMDFDRKIGLYDS